MDTLEEHSLSISFEEEARDIRAARERREAEAIDRIAALPEGVIPRPDDVEVPQNMQPATGISRILKGRKARKATAYRRGFIEGRTQAAIHDPSRLSEQYMEGTAGSAVHHARVKGHIEGYNSFPRQEDA